MAPIIRKLASDPQTNLLDLIQNAYGLRWRQAVSEEAIPSSLKELADMCAYNLAMHAELGRVISWRELIHPIYGEPAFDSCKNLIQTFLRINHGRSTSQNTPSRLVELSREKLDELATLDEPARSIKWSD